MKKHIHEHCGRWIWPPVFQEHHSLDSSEGSLKPMNIWYGSISMICFTRNRPVYVRMYVCTCCTSNVCQVTHQRDWSFQNDGQNSVDNLHVCIRMRARTLIHKQAKSFWIQRIYVVSAAVACNTAVSAGTQSSRKYVHEIHGLWKTNIHLTAPVDACSHTSIHVCSYILSVCAITNRIFWNLQSIRCQTWHWSSSCVSKQCRCTLPHPSMKPRKLWYWESRCCEYGTVVKEDGYAWEYAPVGLSTFTWGSM